MRSLRLVGLVAVAFGLGAVGCGGSSNSPSGSNPSGYQITISNLSYSPLNLNVPPGATVNVVNNDSMAHSVTSEAAQNDFTPGTPVQGVSFDTGAFTGQKSFTIPSSAPDGSVIPYYCSVHKGTMRTPNGTITVDSSATAAPPPQAPSGPGGY